MSCITTHDVMVILTVTAVTMMVINIILVIVLNYGYLGRLFRRLERRWTEVDLHPCQACTHTYTALAAPEADQPDELPLLPVSDSQPSARMTPDDQMRWVELQRMARSLGEADDEASESTNEE